MFFDTEYFTKSPRAGLKWRNRKDIKGHITIEVQSEVINIVSEKWIDKNKSLARTHISPARVVKSNSALTRSAPPVSPSKFSLSFDIPYFRRDNTPVAITERERPIGFILPSEDNMERIVSYNVGALVSNGAGWMYPEQLSLFTK